MQAWFSFCCLTLIYNAMLSFKIILKCAHVRIGYLCGTWMLRVLHSFWTCWKLCFWGEQHGKKESTAVREVILGKKIGVRVSLLYGSGLCCRKSNSWVMVVCLNVCGPSKTRTHVLWLFVGNSGEQLLDWMCILKCLHNALMPATKFTIVLMQKMWWGLRNRCSFKCICDDNRCRHKLVLLYSSVPSWKKSELTLVHLQFLSVLAHWIMKEGFALCCSVTDQQKSAYVCISHLSLHQGFACHDPYLHWPINEANSLLGI
jgi:hypothetical protein